MSSFFTSISTHTTQKTAQFEGEGLLTFWNCASETVPPFRQNRLKLHDFEWKILALREEVLMPKPTNGYMSSAFHLGPRVSHLKITGNLDRNSKTLPELSGLHVSAAEGPTVLLVLYDWCKSLCCFRTPDDDPRGPWCFTDIQSGAMEYCSIPLCGEYRLWNTVPFHCVGSTGHGVLLHSTVW